MAFDGATIAAVVSEMKSRMTGGRIYKIYQPEPDELLLVIKNNKETSRLLLSAGAGLPLIYFTNTAKTNPMVAPNFCMLLRKHILNGRILEIRQPRMERIVEILIEHRNEMGDLCKKRLITEIMGKHSNIIFVNEENVIIDSIKHISAQISSVREVLPGRDYQAPPDQGKIPLWELDEDYLDQVLLKKPASLQKAVYGSLCGISPLLAAEICHRAGLDGGDAAVSLTAERKEALYRQLQAFSEAIRDERFCPNIVYLGGEPKEYAAFALTSYPEGEAKTFSSMSEVLETFYAEKEVITRIRQKSSDLRRIIGNALERTSRKYDLQRKQLADTEKRDKYKIYGELLHTYGYQARPGDKEITCINYYDGQEIRIPLDPTLDPMANAKKYFDRYGKLKRTYEALTSLVEETGAQMRHLESISNALEISREESDLTMIRRELVEYGYMKGHGNRGKKVKSPGKTRPFHYISSDGFHMYVGKNNYQNDELSFKFANGKDMWFHAKQMAGSHVIVKLETADDLPDRTYEEAARLAAYYSKGRQAPKVDVDYTRRRNLKKPPHSKPGFVIYHTNYSMTIEPDITGIREIKD